MQKILLILCAILTTTSVHATQMCARRDTTVIPLDAAVQATVHRNDNLERIWWNEAPYGNLYGISTCLSAPEIQEYAPTWKESDGYLSVLPTDTEEIQGRGETYTTSDDAVYDRRYCYCKLTHPMSSRWVNTARERASDSKESCLGRCDFACTYLMLQPLSSIIHRANLFLTIGYDYTEINTNEYDESIDLN